MARMNCSSKERGLIIVCAKYRRVLRTRGFRSLTEQLVQSLRPSVRRIAQYVLATPRERKLLRLTPGQRAVVDDVQRRVKVSYAMLDRVL